jgi:hypothetical protein
VTYECVINEPASNQRDVFYHINRVIGVIMKERPFSSASVMHVCNLGLFRGQLPSAAELNYLDKVKWLEMYGVDLHPVLVRYNNTLFIHRWLLKAPSFPLYTDEASTRDNDDFV